MKILIIDDQKDMREIYRAVSEMLPDDEIEVIESGLEAVKFLDENEVDACLVDLAMPSFDGLATVKEIRQNEALHLHCHPSRLAFYTAHQASIDETVKDFQDQYNVERVFVKPIEPFELVERVGAWIQEGQVS